jgi:hypothetical protein
LLAVEAADHMFDVDVVDSESGNHQKPRSGGVAVMRIAWRSCGLRGACGPFGYNLLHFPL